MKPLRLGAVGYLNARPLTWALDRAPQGWEVRYDVPSVCAGLLHEGKVDLALIPSVEYLHAADYKLVPGVGVVSDGPVGSVALYTRVPLDDIRHIALDTSSRTSVALIKVLCHYRFHIQPEFRSHTPDLAEMTRDSDAALLIGDPALEVNHGALGLEKIDLGAQWTAMTGLPFVYAAWTGRPGAIGADGIRILQEARDEGVRATVAIAAEYGGDDAVATARARAYLRDNVKYDLGSDEAAGLQMFLDYAVDLGIFSRRRVLEFF
jgi:chorismate dehydratase